MKSTPNIPRPLLSSRLRDDTADVHADAERSRYITQLMGGELPITAYVQLLAQYLPVYCELEATAERLAHDPVVGGFARAAVQRRAAIEADLIALAGADWASITFVTEATDAYVSRIHDVCADWPAGFVAHQYVRYLGDLSGGQFIRHRLSRLFDLTDDAGLSFYVFDQIDNGVQFKKRYRNMLDQAPWNEDEQDRVVAEARVAFGLNIDVFASLDARSATTP